MADVEVLTRGGGPDGFNDPDDFDGLAEHAARLPIDRD
jgi:hypothetical protein